MPFPPDVPEKIRQKLADGVLPREAPQRMYAGDGSDRLCDACDSAIVSTQIEYEFEATDGRVFRLHLGCASLWEAERKRRD